MINFNLQEKTEKSIMTDMLVGLFALAVISVYYYGSRAFAIILISVLTCLLSDVICIKIKPRKKNWETHGKPTKPMVTPYDVAASVITGLVIALMMSAAVPYSMVIIAGIFGSVIGRQAFGGLKHEIFSPAAVGFLFTSLCFSEAMLSYPKAFDKIGVNDIVQIETLTPSINRALVSGTTGLYPIMNVLTGNIIAPMGTAFLIVLFVCAVFMILRRSASFVGFFTQLSIVFVFSYIYFEYSLLAVLNMFASSGYLFGLIFLSCINKKNQRTKSAWFIFAVITSLIFIIIEFYSKAENAIIYAVIIAAPIGIDLDRYTLSLANVLKGDKGIVYKIRSKFDKQLSNVSETLNMLDNKDSEQ